MNNQNYIINLFEKTGINMNYFNVQDLVLHQEAIQKKIQAVQKSENLSDYGPVFSHIQKGGMKSE